MEWLGPVGLSREQQGAEHTHVHAIPEPAMIQVGEAIHRSRDQEVDGRDAEVARQVDGDGRIETAGEVEVEREPEATEETPGRMAEMDADSKEINGEQEIGTGVGDILNARWGEDGRPTKGQDPEIKIVQRRTPSFPREGILGLVTSRARVGTMEETSSVLLVLTKLFDILRTQMGSSPKQ